MENNYLDRRVREALENWSEPLQPTHWEQFEQTLNDPANADLSEQALDHEIRHQLGAVNPALDPGHWEQFEQTLNDPANADLSEHALDHEIRHQLTEVSPAVNAGHWDLFEKQLDQVETDSPEIEDVYLDGVTYELLNEMEVPYDPTHWPLMENRLNEEFSFRRKLIRYKVAEVALLALALFTVFQFIPLEKLSTFRFPAVGPKSQSTTVEQAAIDPSNASPNNNSEAHSNLNIAQLFPSSNTDQEATTDHLSTAQGSGDIIPTLRPTDLALAGQAALAQEAQPLTTNSLEKPQPLNLMKAIPAQALASDADQKPSLPQQGLGYEIVEEQLSDKQITAALDKNVKKLFPLLKGRELGPLATSGTPDLVAPCLACEIWKGPSFLRIGMIGMGDLNYVMTPYNEEYGQKSYNRFESGYGGGLTLGFKFGRWEIEGGALYASKRYRADTINYLVTQNDLGIGKANLGYEGKGWKETQLDLLRIPLRARYGFTHRGKWQFYAQGGAALNVAMNVIHNNQLIRFEQRHQNPDGGLRSQGENNLPEEKRINYEDVTENFGILDSGNFLEQSFLSIDIGLGIERFLSPRFSVFSQPVFHYQLTPGSFGINQEKINNFSVEVGVRVSLKKNTPEVR